MRTNIRLKLDMSQRAVEFCRQHPDDSPAYATAVTKLEGLVHRATTLAQQQQAGRIAAEASVVSKSECRRGIRKDLESLRDIADAAALRQPEIPVRLQLPDKQVSEKVFLATSRVAVAEATASKELLVTYGMPETMLDSLTQALNQYEEAVTNKHRGITTHVGASADLAAVTDEIMEAVQHVDALNRLRFRDNAELLAAWDSARNVAWPAKNGSAPGPTGNEEKPAA
jgi:hypothetical protein